MIFSFRKLAKPNIDLCLRKKIPVRYDFSSMVAFIPWQNRQRKRTGFTMIEMCISILVLVLIIAIAVPSLRGVLAERRLRGTFDAFDQVVAQTQRQSVREHIPYLLRFRPTENALYIIEARDQGTKTKHKPRTTKVALPKRGQYQIFFPNSFIKNPPLEWMFWPTGNCEPTVVQFQGAAGKWMAYYNPLTATALLESFQAY